MATSAPKEKYRSNYERLKDKFDQYRIAAVPSCLTKVHKETVQSKTIMEAVTHVEQNYQINDELLSKPIPHFKLKIYLGESRAYTA